MSTFVGGKLKLKGGLDPSQLKGGVKKKKKSSKGKEAAEGTELALVPADGGKGGDQQQQADPSHPPGVVAVTKDGMVLDPNAVVDKRTEAEKKAEAHFLKYEEARASKAALKSHRDRIKELNEKLSNLTEHNDIFRISYTS